MARSRRAQPARASAASGGCTCRGVWRAKSCADRHRANSPNTRAIPRGASRSAVTTRCLPPLTARRSCRTSTAGAATARSRTSATSSSSPMPRPGCTTRAARCASRSTCRSTSVDTVYAHIRYSDKPFMGSVTSAARAADSIEMCRLLFGADFVESHCVILGNVNVNSPLVLDGEASRVIRTYAAANQAPVCVPFIDRPAGAAARRAAALRRESLRVQDRRCPGGLRERELDVAGVPRGRELRAARRAGSRRGWRCPTRNSSWTAISWVRSIRARRQQLLRAVERRRGARSAAARQSAPEEPARGLPAAAARSGPGRGAARVRDEA